MMPPLRTEVQVAGFVAPTGGHAAMPSRALSQEQSALALPADLCARAVLPAWGIALALHAALAGLVLFTPPAAPPAEEPLVRMVFVAPPPPPPAALGMPAGAGTMQAPVAPEVKPQPALRQSEPRVVPQRERLARPADKPKPKPKAKPAAPPIAPVVAPPAAAPVAEVASGTPTGAVGGEAAGVVGGVQGGVAGGGVGGTGAGPLPAGKVAHPPVLLRRVEPVYPQAARRQQVEGLVVLEAILDREGRVEPAVKVLRSVPLLDREALAAVRKWRFRPARDATGDPVRVILEVPIRFVLR